MLDGDDLYLRAGRNKATGSFLLNVIVAGDRGGAVHAFISSRREPK